MNSCLIGLQVWPVLVRKLIAVIHSSVVMLQGVSVHNSELKSSLSILPGFFDKLVEVGDQTREDKLGSSVSIVRSWGQKQSRRYSNLTRCTLTDSRPAESNSTGFP